MVAPMVDWDRVEELRSKGVGWDKIASDPKVAFHADASAGDPGRQLRALYHRSRSRERGGKPSAPSGGKGPATPKGTGEGWSLIRALYLVVPIVAVWFSLAYVIPAPIGLVLPAIPYLGLILVGVVMILLWALWRSTSGPRWSRLYRNTAIGGVVLGLVLSGLIGLTGTLAFGCPFLPPASSLTSASSSGWQKVPTSAWQENGLPVFFSFGTTWCPFCSASSWSEFKALSFFGTVSGTSTEYSSASDTDPQTPEIVLAYLTLGPRNGHTPGVSVQIQEDTSNNRANAPGTSNCTQQAYLSSYDPAGSIPFLVVNGQFVHTGSLNDPPCLQPWAAGANGGAGAVQTAVETESGTTGGNPWTCVSEQSYWIAAMIVVGSGQAVTTFKTFYGWNVTDTNQIQTDVNLLS